ncbi:MAG: hypothetical protein U9O53_05285 [archaeon]|nr:hypothetical protein [archaeon]
MENMHNEIEEFDENIINLVIARLESMPKNIKMSIGSKGQFDKFQLIDHVKNKDDIGNTIIKMQLFYLRSLKDM